MKHIFVETNFLVSLLRPFPAQDAVDLFARNDGKDLRLYIPWCSQAEAGRTMVEIIKADLGFTDTMMKFVVQAWLRDRSLFDKRELDKVKDLADAERGKALETIEDKIAGAVAKMTCISPSQAVVTRTLEVFAVKTLKPFDEMVLGAVLAKAAELYDAGERDLVFCDTDGDLASQHPPLLEEYAACGLTVLDHFSIPVSP